MVKLIVNSAAFLALVGSAAVFAGQEPDPWAHKVHKPRHFQTAPVVAASPEIAAEGGAWLQRTKHKVEARVMAKVAKANTPYSIWWVIFNRPWRCIDVCGPADLADGGAAAGVAVFNASGAISASDGQGGGIINVSMSMINNERAGRGSQDAPIPPGMNQPPPFFWRTFWKNNGFCAEIHLDINEHDFDGDWVQELTYPENPQAFAVFERVGCLRMGANGGNGGGTGGHSD